MTTPTPSSDFVHAFFEQHPDAVLVLDPLGRVLQANPAAAWLGPPDALPSFAAMTGIAWPHDARGIAQAGGRWNRRVRMRGADGQPRQVDVSVFGVALAAGDAPLHYCVLRDATASVLAARAGLEGESRSKATSDSAPVLVWMCGPELQHEWFNRSWLTFRGRSLGDELGDGWQDGVHPEDLERCLSIHAHCFEQREPFTLDYRLRRHDGAARWVLETGVPRIGQDGTFLGFIGTCVDITDRKELEDRLAERTRALRLADERREAVLAKLSHELRNPLAPIANAAALLRRFDDVDPRLAAMRAIIERQVDHLRRLVTDLVDVTQVTRGRVVLQREALDVSALLDDAIDATRAALDGRSQWLRVERDDHAYDGSGDVQRLAQALAALIANAAKYSPPDSEIGIATRVEDGTLSITVSDHGRGIASEFLPHAAEPFAQDGADHHEGGLGVGLTIARHIAELHGGTLCVHSDGPGTGTTATLRLPRTAPAQAGRADGLELADFAGQRVLIIEDNDDARDSLRLLIETIGGIVRTARDAGEGLRSAREFEPQVVVCDLGLPDADGCDLVRELRDALPPGATRFVALTGFGRVEERDRALDSGFDTFLVKPLSPRRTELAAAPRGAL